jgi:hypothetical protein
MCDYGWDGYNVGIQLREEREQRMAEKAQNPIERKSQQPDEQNKTTVERVEKQTIKKGDFTKSTIKPDVQK